jgi:hypothetical protein
MSQKSFWNDLKKPSKEVTKSFLKKSQKAVTVTFIYQLFTRDKIKPVQAIKILKMLKKVERLEIFEKKNPYYLVYKYIKGN